MRLFLSRANGAGRQRAPWSMAARRHQRRRHSSLGQLEARTLLSITSTTPVPVTVGETSAFAGEVLHFTANDAGPLTASIIWSPRQVLGVAAFDLAQILQDGEQAHAVASEKRAGVEERPELHAELRCVVKDEQGPALGYLFAAQHHGKGRFRSTALAAHGWLATKHQRSEGVPMAASEGPSV